jgi:integrase
MAGGRGHRKRKTTYRGEVVYIARAFYKGKKKESRCATERECIEREHDLYWALKREVDGQEDDGTPQRAPSGPTTLASAMRERALALEGSTKTSPESATRARSFLKTFLDAYAGLALTPVAAISEAMLAAYRDQRVRAGRAAATVNRELRELRAAIKTVVPHFKLADETFLPENMLHVDSLNPEEAALMKQEGERGKPGKRGHGWNPETEGLYWPFSAMERIFLIHGLRVSELSRLRKEHVHLDLGEILVTVKGGETKYVQLSEEALAIVRDAMERPENTTPFLFPNLKTGHPYTRTSVSRVHRLRAYAALGRRFRLHDTRHHAGTTGMKAGATTAEIQQYLRLESPAMVARYARFERAGQRSLADAIAGITSGAPPVGSDSLPASRTPRPAEAARPSRAPGRSPARSPVARRVVRS